jgi:phosphoglycolate phosphatase
MSIEIVRPDFPRGLYRVALWDFDGTLSLYRGGWQQVMVEMMVGELAACGSGEPAEQLASLASEWVVALNGKPTIHQMTRLAEEITHRGGSPRDPQHYCAVYQERLLAVVDQRMASVERGEQQPLDHGVAGVEPMLALLAERGVTLVLASGTEYDYVFRELTALGLAPFFGPRVYAPRGHDREFSKRGVIERVLRETQIPGEKLVSFGDGVVETAEVKRIGGCAVGVASDEQGRAQIDLDKRRQLIAAGADVIVPNFVEHALLAEQLRIE